MILNTIQNFQRSKDKRNFECIWCLQSYKKSDVDSWLSEENRETVSGFYKKSRPKI